jgi:hypothetical protein
MGVWQNFTPFLFWHLYMLMDELHESHPQFRWKNEKKFKNLDILYTPKSTFLIV